VRPLSTKRTGPALGCGCQGASRCAPVRLAGAILHPAEALVKKCEWPWPAPLASHRSVTRPAVLVYRADAADDAAPTVRAAAALAFHSSRTVAVLIGQRVIGTKSFEK
jgi:hypothetical protein